MISIGKHTVRCPKCNSDEYLQESKMTFPTGAKATIKTCCECGQTYIVKNDKKKKSIGEILGVFFGYVLIAFMITLSLAMLYIMYIILRWICIGLWG